MARRYVVAGSAGQSVDVFLQDRSSGDGVITMTTDKVRAAYRIGTTGAVTTFALVGRNTTAAWASGGWAECSSVNMPGVYTLDVPDASIATTPNVSYFIHCSTPGSNFLPIALDLQVVSSGGSDMPANIILYKGQSQTSVDIGAKLTSINAETTAIVSKVTSINAETTAIVAKVTSIDANTTAIIQKLSSMDTTLGVIGSRVTSIEANTTGIVTKVSSIDTKVTAIQAQTTQFTFTTAGIVDANMVRVAGASTTPTNLNTAFDTNFATVYDSTNNTWRGAAASLSTSDHEAIALAVWDEAASSHVTAGTFGKHVGDIISKVTSIETNTTGMVTKLTSVETDVDSVLNKVTSINTETTTLIANVAAVKAETTAIKAKTDSLAFTVAGKVNANVHYINDVQVQGAGTTVDTWRPV